ncbi:ATP-binding protein [Planosporangium sp. 12N6]|uniref:sensor histidine kinase n=1 Tax=Planosporangium spinosum TaxID=3402278 RepID=UPI003CF65835
MSRHLTWRQRMARRLDPSIVEVTTRRAVEPPPPPPPPSTPSDERAQNLWPAICEQFALRILATAYQMGTQLEAVEADEQDAERLEKLYRIDHANTRIRRQAENLQVLLGRKVDDASRQVTPLLDVIRAATSAIEYYSRVQIGQMVPLAVTAFAADDVIRVLTELLDNATRFSPPTSSVIVSAYLTEHGSVLVRIEDSGVGVKTDQLAPLNSMLAGNAPPPLDGNPVAHLGLVVVARLAVAHHLRVHLTNRPSGGTTASVVVPDALLCEIAPATRPGAPAASHTDVSTGNHAVPTANHAGPGPRASARATSPAHRLSGGGNPYHGSAQVPVSHLMLVNGQPSEEGGRHGRRETGGGNALPRRVRESLRDSAQSSGTVRPLAPSIPESRISPEFRTPPEVGSNRDAWPDETADFAAGISDAFATGSITASAPGGSDVSPANGSGTPVLGGSGTSPANGSDTFTAGGADAQQRTATNEPSEGQPR